MNDVDMIVVHSLATLMLGVPEANPAIKPLDPAAPAGPAVPAGPAAPAGPRVAHRTLRSVFLQRSVGFLSMRMAPVFLFTHAARSLEVAVPERLGAASAAPVAIRHALPTRPAAAAIRGEWDMGSSGGMGWSVSPAERPGAYSVVVSAYLSVVDRPGRVSPSKSFWPGNSHRNARVPDPAAVMR